MLVIFTISDYLILLTTGRSLYHFCVIMNRIQLGNSADHEHR